MTPTTLAAALLKDVPRHGFQKKKGVMIYLEDALSALTAALDPALAERAGHVVERLRFFSAGIGTQAATSGKAADLITDLLAQNTALRAERDEHYNDWCRALTLADKAAALMSQMDERRLAAEAERDALRNELRFHVDDAVKAWNATEAAEARIAALTEKVERLTGAVWLKVGECLAGMTHAEVSPAARRMIEKAIRAALSATEEGHE